MPKLIDVLRLPSTLGFIDEGHLAHEGAETYRPFFSLVSRILSATATPFTREYSDQDIHEAAGRVARGFGRNLITIMDKSYEESIEFLREQRILSRIIKREIITGDRFTIESLGSDSEVSSDESRTVEVEHALAAFTDSNRRRLAIAEAVIPEIRAVKEARVLYFGPTVQDAELMAITLRAYGIRSAAISGKTSKASRHRILREFRSGAIEVLCNCQLLTTGFDDPKISHVIMARPTVSRALYEQMLGRGLRGPEFGGTETCVVYEILDEFVDRSGAKLRYNGELLPKPVWKLISRRFN